MGERRRREREREGEEKRRKREKRGKRRGGERDRAEGTNTLAHETNVTDDVGYLRMMGETEVLGAMERRSDQLQQYML